ncbi:Mrp/NBP35 family ATP-binding protein [candidate division KSB1 bacterium]|nr:Mrp/NBP35 family ATP-binding protein [candidate division KSB1 bacterium]MBL7093614.1 Mrp/NBP35 family ATP-binding protein [candidate division KSB1 bacterium]
MIKENMAKIKHKIIIMSGKGGVGKSTVATSLAFELAKNGRKVGILDTDVHGPSLGKMLGIEGQFIMPSEKGNTLIPIEAYGIKIVTMASLLQDSDAPVIWRGPLKMGAIKQFLGEIEWGELDYLIIDSPPGTGDEPLSVCQLIPEADGSIIVTTPQDVALIDSRKTVRFSEALKIPVLGIVENMAGLKCPHCGEPINLFKIGGGEKAAENMQLTFLGRIPIEPEIVESCDNGNAYVYDFADQEAAKSLHEIANKIMEKVEKKNVSV